MKCIILFIISFPLWAQVDLIKCREVKNNEPNGIKRVTKLLEIKLLKDVTRQMDSDADLVHEVEVTIINKVDNNKMVLKRFVTYAQTRDVEFTINTKKRSPFNFYLYLDEMDQAGMEFRGVTYKLTCK